MSNMKNVFTEYLIEKGWLESAPMTYTKMGNNYEIFFDNSNQIEIYLNSKRVRNIRLLELDDLIQLLDTLK